jgi:phage portal protein BeeE
MNQVDQVRAMQEIKVRPEDMQFLETRHMQRAEICRIFEVSPELLTPLDAKSIHAFTEEHPDYLLRRNSGGN